ncbi:uncharacterized protein KY384_003591 [Bacidia gigantensis]|uniref:uncharacterized protein n=1 Tax=Bacidia gigantensis TaxID=2732470 RepID=UPI001D0524E0|nr:uncharacterized protein KY384_003591 [Bacidia gigantensis]KAG8531955.1 hypothetical protein KY384_003591 [Bacidia gigantensis]
MQFASFVPLILLSFSFIHTVVSADKYPTELVYEAPNGTWLENLAVRADGSILATVLTSPDLLLIQPDPKNPAPKLIASFPPTLPFWELQKLPRTPATNFTSATVSGVLGSGNIYRVDLPRHPHHPNGPVHVSLTSHLPDDTGLPNGLLSLNNQTLLLAESNNGTILAINTVTGASTVAINDPLLLPANGNPIGINGLKLHGNTLYFTNSGLNTFNRVPIDLTTGAALGPATVIATGLTGKGIAYDDFALSSDGKRAFLTTTGGNTVAEVDTETGGQRTVAGDFHSTEIAQPTGAAFGRGKGQKGIVYVTTAGGIAIPVNGYEKVGGQLLAIHVG